MNMDNNPPVITNFITSHKVIFFGILNSKNKNTVDIGTPKDPVKIRAGIKLDTSNCL